MEEIQVIETTSGRQFKPWATKDDVQDPASVTAIASEIASGKQAIAAAINAKGGTASASESFSELAQDIQDTPTSGVLSDGIVQSEPFSFLDYVCKQDAYPVTEIDDDSVTIIDRPNAVYKQTRLLKVKMTALTTISNSNAFHSCSSLQEINMPNLTTISGGSAFYNCSSLQEINMPNLTTISGGNAFYNCSSLQEINMPNLTTISGGSAFFDCSSLQEINMPNLTTISGASTFRSTSSLQSISLPSLERVSGGNANESLLYNSGVMYVYFPKLNTITYNGLLRNCPVIDIQFGTLVQISDPLFNAKPALRNITIGQGTNTDLPFQYWTATNVIAEGQSSIDELNANIQNNLVANLKDNTGATAKTVTFGQTLRNVLTTETEQMFANKNWNTAPAKTV